jgi:type IV pilus assembly protein PilA
MKRNNKSGFTLVELMVVVGIIGILIALVAPNLTSFTAKAKQSSAKVELSGLYTAEKAFQAEYSSYHGNLPYIGHVPDGCSTASSACNAASKRPYSVGFSAVGVNADLVAGVTTAITGTAVFHFANSVGAAQSIPGTVSLGGTANRTTTTTQNTFVAAAQGLISLTTADVWAIDHNKILSNTSKGY